MKTTVLTAVGIAGGMLSLLFGGWSTSMTTLAVCMATDYLTGFAVAAVFKKSPKSANGALESRAGFKGLLRKVAVLLSVLVAHRLDIALGTCFVKDGVVTAYIINDILSIIENLGLMGVPMPDILAKAVDMLRKDTEK